MNTIVLAISGLILGWLWCLYRTAGRSREALLQEAKRLCQEGMNAPHTWDREVPPGSLQRHVMSVWAKHPEAPALRKNLRTSEDTELMRQCEALVEQMQTEDD